MINISAIRWGQPYESLDTETIVHFATGEPIARLSQANGGLVQRDVRKAQAARDLLRSIPCVELIDRCRKAADAYLHGNLPLGDGKQSPDEFVHAQSATTGLPEHMCRANMRKNHYVLSNIGEMLDALTRGPELSILTRGYGTESRGVTVSYQANSPVLGLVLPSNSPGVHTLWLPVIPLQIGLVIKPGSQEIWTPYRIFAAMVEAGIPAEAFSLYPGGHEVGGAVMTSCQRSMIFGGQATIEKHKGDPRIQVHGPGFSKILLGDDVVDRWEEYLDLMVESIYSNGGRSCINASSVWASRHTKEIAEALARRLGPIDVKPPTDPDAGLAAFTVPDAAAAIWKSIEAGFREVGVSHATDAFGTRLVEQERCGYLRPTIVHCKSPAPALAKAEYMFPYAAVVECPQEKMIEQAGATLVCTAITSNSSWRQQLTDATNIDRLNVGPIPTNQLDWLQPHEGNLVDFLFRARAYQVA
jgi:acyl-CoA reductase-like NAD-dependent aldehyde dehydrogenase